MVKKRQILVIGHNTKGCTPEHEKAAYEVGSEIAKSNSVLITGGLGGIMTAAAHGAKDANGLTIGIIPQDDASLANEYCDIVIPTGMGLTRDFLNALSADGIIIVGGGSGTLSETCAAYMHKKPMVAIRNLQSSVDQYIDGYLDHRENVKIIGCRYTTRSSIQNFGIDSLTMNPLFQLSTRTYEKEIPIIRQALDDLEKECQVSNGYTLDEPFTKFGWTFFNLQISEEMVGVIEKSGMMEGALGFKITEQLTNFVGHFLETKGSNVRIKNIEYG